jgi:hypothetical protein
MQTWNSEINNLIKTLEQVFISRLMMSSKLDILSNAIRLMIIIISLSMMLVEHLIADE